MGTSNGSRLIRLGCGFRDILVNWINASTADVVIAMLKTRGGRLLADECLSKDPMVKLGRCVTYIVGQQNALTTTLIQQALSWFTPLTRGELTKTRMLLLGSKNRHSLGFGTTPLADSMGSGRSQGVETRCVERRHLTSGALKGPVSSIENAARV
jgi:hypothetical protein